MLTLGTTLFTSSLGVGEVASLEVTGERPVAIPLHLSVADAADHALVSGGEGVRLGHGAPLHPTGASVEVGPRKVGAARRALASGATVLASHSGIAEIVSSEVATQGPVAVP